MAHALSKIEGFQKRKDMFFVHPDSIIVVNGWNKRTDFTGEEELMESIKELGVLEAIEVRKTKDNTLELVDGERRLRATLRANKEGSDIQSVPVVLAPLKMNEIDLFIRSIVRNTGKPFTPSEEAASFKQLIAYGYSVKKIAKTVGRSYGHVQGRLGLSNGIDEVKKAVDSKEITLKEAGKIIDESDGKVQEQIQKLQEIKEEKKEKKKPKPAKKENFEYTEWNFCQEIDCKGYSFKACNFKLENCPMMAKDFIFWMNKNNLKLVKK